MCVKQIKYEYQICVFIIVLLMLYYKKCVLKVSKKLLFGLLSYFSNMKNVRSNRWEAAFSFLSYFCNMKHMCPKQARFCFCNTKNVCSEPTGGLLLQHETGVFKTRERLLLRPPIINKYDTSKMFILQVS